MKIATLAEKVLNKMKIYMQ